MIESAEMSRSGTLRLVVVSILIRPGYLKDDWHFMGPNVAQGMHAAQGPDTFDFNQADLAVDGNTDADTDHDSCSHTGSNTGAWWSVDLQNSFVIKGIRIYTRDSHLDRLINFRIVGNPGNVELYNDQQALQQTKLYQKAIIEIPVNVIKPFTKITVRIPGSYLTLCEVQIYAELCKLPQVSGHSALGFKHTGNEIKGSYIHVGSVMHLTCKPKTTYRLLGADVVSCQADGSYNDSIPNCVKYCPIPPRVTNGHYTHEKSSYLPGDWLWIKCDANFSSRTDTKLTCTADSIWSEPNPTCSIITCSHPGSLTHGQYLFNNGSRYLLGSVSIYTTVSVTCAEGFVAVSARRICSSTGAWTGDEDCREISSVNCSLYLLQTKENFYTLDNNTGDFIGYNATIKTSCQPGYERRSGEHVRQCLANQTLSGTELLCSVNTSGKKPTTITIKSLEKNHATAKLVGGVCGAVAGVVVVIVVILMVVHRRRIRQHICSGEDEIPNEARAGQSNVYTTGLSNVYTTGQSKDDTTGQSNDYTTGQSNDYTTTGQSNDDTTTGQSNDYTTTGQSNDYTTEESSVDITDQSDGYEEINTVDVDVKDDTTNDCHIASDVFTGSKSKIHNR